MPKKQLVAEAMIDLHRRLNTLPTRSHERRMIMQETANLYGGSEQTLYSGDVGKNGGLPPSGEKPNQLSSKYQRSPPMNRINNTNGGAVSRARLPVRS